MNKPKSLSTALRERARFLRDHYGKLEYSAGDESSVIAALYEFADVVDSWSGEYLSKEETYKENQRRRWGNRHWNDPEPAPMTMEERIGAVKNKQQF